MARDDPVGDRTMPRAQAAEAQSFVRHELRTPLAVLQPVLDMLLSGTAGDLEPKQREYVTMLERNVTRLSAMITSLVETGWLELAALPLQEDTVDVAALVGELVAAVPSALATSPRVQTPSVTSWGATGPPLVRADPYRLRLALRNVLVNACVFTPVGGDVGVTVKRAGEGAFIEVEVADNGRGIPADELPHVFDLGFQGTATQEVPARGLGLGLSVTRRLVEATGGTVRIESEAGSGTTVFVRLPASPV